MSSVTQRIKVIKQPRGGYINPRVMDVQQLDDDNPTPLDHTGENIHSSLVGLAVDYLSRLMTGTEPRNAFRISLRGAHLLTPTFGDSVLARALKDVDSLVPGHLDTASIKAACRLAGFDVVFRAGMYNPQAKTNPDAVTVQHIATMVQRSLTFFKTYGPVTLDGFTLEGGYTDIVDSGDGDFLTADTLWDFKVSVKGPTSAHTLQLLMYYLMGKRSIHEEFKTITHLGVYNPRLNTVYRIPVSSIPAETITEVEHDVIGYA